MATPLRGALLGMLIPRIMNGVAREFQKERHTLLKGVQGKVCDVGSGGGAYVRHCHQAQHLVAVEPIHQMHGKIRAACPPTVPRLEILSSLDDLDLPTHQGSFDWVILGNVLCEVDDVPSTLQRVDRLLKPGGYVYFSEHVGCPRGTWMRWWQDTINPFWRHVGGGCNCNRDSVHHLRAMSGWQVVDFWYPHVKVCGGPFVMGLAQKAVEPRSRDSHTRLDM